MIKQSKDYITKKKKSFLQKSFLWGAIVLGIFLISWYFTKERANYYTILAAVLVIPLAQNITRYISFRKFQDPKPDCARALEGMKGSYALYHGAILPDTRQTVYFSHLVITSRSIYCITDSNETLKEVKNWITERFIAKGFEAKSIHLVYAEGPKAIKNVALKIEKDACYTNEELNNRIAVIEAMLM